MGNNLSIRDVALVNTGGGEADIEFTMSWDNSWHESWTDNGGTVSVTNWDAVWVFAKYRQTGGLWKHVRLAATGHTATGGTVIDLADNGGGERMGAFVHRSTAGAGTVTCANMRLHWNLAASGINSPADIDLTVMGVEMVYIPEGSFSLGSGGTETYHFHVMGDPDTPYIVTSEAEIGLHGAAGDLDWAANGLVGTIPAAFPKGFQAFYCMKYEITEEQYVDYLNLLDPTVAAPLFPNANGAHRHTIAEAAGGGYETGAPDRACSYLFGHQWLSYLDWAGLRPMTELEFEKACRGVKEPWVNEYAWGNSSFTGMTGFNGTDGSGTETATPAGANVHVLIGIDGPVRAGIFATGTSSRESAGAGYYGVMNLSDNLRERTATLTRGDGWAFDGSHGDGDEYTPLLWSQNYYDYGTRGGSFRNESELGQVSNRVAAGDRDTFRYQHPQIGGRGVRTAP
jgi:formylglycine-generating enzyme required for sulfatase activity